MSRQKGKTSLAPIDNNKVAGNDIQQPVVDNGALTEDSNIDAYLNQNNTPAQNDFSEKDAEIAVLNEKIETLEKEKHEVIDDNRTLLDKIEILLKEKESSNTDEFKKEIDELKNLNTRMKNENDSLILKNSELEFEIARLNETLKTIQSKIDQRLHTYTNPGYSGHGGYVPSQNGYQDWR